MKKEFLEFGKKLSLSHELSRNELKKVVGGTDGGDGWSIAPHFPPPFSRRDGVIAVRGSREDQVRSRPLASSYHRTEPWTDRRANRLRVRNPAAAGDGPVLWHQPQ